MHGETKTRSLQKKISELAHLNGLTSIVCRFVEEKGNAVLHMMMLADIYGVIV